MTSPRPIDCNLCRGELDHDRDYCQCAECPFIVCADCSREDSDWTSDRYCLKCIEEKGCLKKCAWDADCQNWLLADLVQKYCGDCAYTALQYQTAKPKSMESQPKKVNKKRKQPGAAKPSTRRAKTSQSTGIHLQVAERF